MLNKAIIVLTYYRHEHSELFTGSVPHVYDKRCILQLNIILLQHFKEES
jgi:hypothetical protein